MSSKERRKYMNDKFVKEMAKTLGVDPADYTAGELLNMLQDGYTPIAKGNFKGGLQTKKYVNPVTIINNRKNK